jgi:hypothetical protein
MASMSMFWNGLIGGGNSGSKRSPAKRPPTKRGQKMKGSDAQALMKWTTSKRPRSGSMTAAEILKKRKNGHGRTYVSKRRKEAEEEEEEEIDEGAEQQTQTPLASLDIDSEEPPTMDLPTVDVDMDEDTYEDGQSSSMEEEEEEEEVEEEPLVEEELKEEEVESPRKKRTKKPKKNKIHQTKAINIILKDVLDYDDVTISKSAKTIISHAGVHFAKAILVKASKIDDVKHRKRIGIEDIRAKIMCTVPSPDLMMRMQREIDRAVDSYTESLENPQKMDAKGRSKPVSGEERAGLHVKMSNVRNLAHISVPNYGGIDKLAYIAVAACMEIMLCEIIHRCVGSLVSAALAFPYMGESRARPGSVEPTIRSASAIRFRIEDHDVYLVLNRTVRVQEIQDMALRHPIFHSRRRDVSTEVERALREAEEITPKSKRPSKRKVIKDTTREVEKWNKEDLLQGDELLFLMSQANALPIIFSNFKVPGARTMPNVRVDMLPEKLQKRCLTDIQCSISSGALDGSMTLRVLDFLSNQYINTEAGRQWVV